MNTAIQSIIASLAAASIAFSCGEPFPTGRVRAYDDFGTEAFRILRDEYLWSSTPEVGATRAAVIASREVDLVAALNAVIVEPVEHGLLPVLERLLHLYDPRPDGRPGALPQMTRDLADILDVVLSDTRTLGAIAALDTAIGANPDAVERLLGTLARHPIRVLDRLVALTLDLEPELTELFRYLHRELPALDDAYLKGPDESGLLERLLAARLDEAPEPVGPIVLSARVDGRGAPVVNRTAGGELPEPFVDADADGAPDIDAAARPVDALGVAIAMPTFSGRSTAGEERDPLGRALVGGTLVYDYFELRQTLLAYVLREARDLLADGVHFDLFTAFEGLLGGRVSRDDPDGPYTGFYAEASPLLDLVHVANALRRYPRLVPLLRALEHVVVARPNLFRQLYVDLAKARAIFADAPSLAPGNSLLEDLHPVLAALADKGLLRSLIAAARTPDNQGMFESLATEMKWTTLDLPSDTEVLATPAQVDNLHFSRSTPWDRPDTADADRSWLQKSAYLMWDTRRAPAFLKLFDRVEVREVEITDDMASFYVRSIADAAVISLGNPLLETLAVELVGEFDDLTPTAEQLNLYMNHDQSETGNPVGNQGIQVRHNYGPALLALQTSGSLKALRPWVRDIVARGGTEDFVDLFAELAPHYSETASAVGGLISHGTGFRKLEPYLVRVFEDTALPGHLLELFAWADQARFDLGGDALNVADELDAFLRWMVDPDAQVALRNGETSIPSKRGGVIARPSRLQLLAHAFDQVDAALDASPTARAAWDRVDLLGPFLDLDASGALSNPRALPLIEALVPILADHLAQAVVEPDWVDSIDSLVGDLEELMASRGFTAATDAMARIRDTPAHRALLDELVAAMFAEEPPSPDTDLFGANLQLLSMASQVRVPMDALTQLLRFLGGLLDPAKRYVFQALETLRDIRAQDPGEVTTALARNLFAEPELGVFPYKSLWQAIKEAQRPSPGAGTAYTPEDFREVLTDLRDWLRDDQKGAERLFIVIRSR